MARWHRLLGEEVFFLTGTDEHGLKIQRRAEKENKAPKAFVDEMSKSFKKLCSEWNFSYDRFIRTTDSDHEKACQLIFQKLQDNGDIYLGKYNGLYCAECETFYLENDLNDGKCKIHEKKCDFVSEESYFFKMSKYEKQLIEFLKKNEKAVLPLGKKKEILNRIELGLKDLSVSRTSFDWGIPIPFNKNHVMYVWTDALSNYITGIGYPNGKDFKKFWPANVQNIGKDILWHHTAIWYSLLLALNVPLPKTIFVHGFINTSSGKKMSKSKGTVIDPLEISKKYSADAVRYFLLREIPFGEDGFFSEELLKQRVNNELANALGNLLNRTIVLLEKNFEGKIPDAKTNSELSKKLDLEKIERSMENFEFHNALNEIFSFVAQCNAFVNEKQPWKQIGKDLDETLYSLADSLRIISILVSPFMPSTSEKINAQLNVKAGSISECKFNLLKAGAQTKKGKILFEKIV